MRLTALLSLMLLAGCTSKGPQPGKDYSVKADGWPTEYYIACGCGCCASNSLPDTVECVYREDGGSLEKVQAQDEAAARAPICRRVGCSFPVMYVYCVKQRGFFL